MLPSYGGLKPVGVGLATDKVFKTIFPPTASGRAGDPWPRPRWTAYRPPRWCPVHETRGSTGWVRAELPAALDLPVAATWREEPRTVAGVAAGIATDGSLHLTINQMDLTPRLVRVPGRKDASGHPLHFKVGLSDGASEVSLSLVAL